MKNRKFSFRERLTTKIVKKFANDLVIEPSVEHPGFYEATFNINNLSGCLLKLIDPKRFHFTDK